jgi:hypothetical protein
MSAMTKRTACEMPPRRTGCESRAGDHSDGRGPDPHWPLATFSALVSADHQSQVLKGNDPAIRHAFQPSPRIGWVSNLRLAKAIQGWIARHDGPKMDRDRVITSVTIIAQRHLGFPMAVDFSRVDSVTPKEGGRNTMHGRHLAAGRSSR